MLPTLLSLHFLAKSQTADFVPPVLSLLPALLNSAFPRPCRAACGCRQHRGHHRPRGTHTHISSDAPEGKHTPQHATSIYPGMPWQPSSEATWDDHSAPGDWQASRALFPDFVTFGRLTEDSDSLISKAGWIPRENTFKVSSFLTALSQYNSCCTVNSWAQHLAPDLVWISRMLTDQSAFSLHMQAKYNNERYKVYIQKLLGLCCDDNNDRIRFY